MRPGQNNNYKNRNRNRNRHRGGGGGGGGGNSNNRVLDSNGPDVKLRGTPQTIAEKYIQLARDAASAGDRVMAESYYQHADHYYRLWLAAQPPGQPIQFGRRPDEEVDDADTAEGDEDGNGDTGNADGAEAGEGQPAEATGEGEAASGDEGQQNRNFRNRDQNNRDQGSGGRDRFRNRWPRRNDRYNENRDGNGPAAEGQETRAEGAEQSAERPERSERSERPERQDRAPRRERTEAPAVAEDRGDWEAPSFLKRPMPAVGDDGEGELAAAERKPRARRPRYGEEGVTANEPPASDD